MSDNLNEHQRLLINELWNGIRHIRDALDEMETSIVGQNLKPLLDCCVDGEVKLFYAIEKPIAKKEEPHEIT
jgi:hypothetical protein